MQSYSMKEDYLAIRCMIPGGMEDELPELLSPWPILGTVIEPLSERAIGITVFLDETREEDARGVGCALTEAGATEIEMNVIEDEDWLAAFRESLQPFEVGDRWWIDPHPERPIEAPAGRQRLVVEPRMAFGAGTHESTQGVLKVLERVEVADRRVLDVGTGSGILAFAAECLAAELVVGVDTDPTAVWVAADCAAQQEWESDVNLVVGSVDCLSAVEFDIVLCNMIASNFLPLATDLRRLLADSGVAIFAGLLASEAESVSRHLEDVGFTVSSRHIDGEWASLTAVAASAP